MLSGRPRFPRIGGMASTRGRSWVTSLRLAPVRMTARGMPCASVIRWCLEPGRARSVGLGPVFDPHPQHEWRKNRRCNGTNRSCRPCASGPTAPHAACPRHLPLARRAGAASNSCPSRSPFPGAASPKGCCFVEQTGCHSERLDHPAACAPDTCSDGAWRAMLST